MILENKVSQLPSNCSATECHLDTLLVCFLGRNRIFLLILQLALSAICVYLPSLMNGMADFHFFQVKLIFTFSACNPVSCYTGLWNLPERSCGGMRPFLEVINLFPSLLFLTS